MSEPNISIVGGESLLGRELRDQLGESGYKASLKLVGADKEVAGVISIEGDEPVVLTALDAGVLENSKVVFLCGSASASGRALEMIAEAKSNATVIDLTGGLEERPEARLRAPYVETGKESFPPGTLHVVAHPAAIVLASMFARLVKTFQVTRAVVQIFEPASERGQSGLNELQQQTAGLLSFKTLSKEIFDAQASFNMLPRYGDDAPIHLEDVEHRIDRHLATLLGTLGISRLPSIRLSQAPVFHGYSFSIWMEFETAPDIAALSQQLATARIEVRAADLEAPTNAGSVGQGGVTVGLIERDRNEPKAVWMWAVADNFRISVDNAIEVARPFLPGDTQ
jgi:aspartate-semialdehyde dehydrogenase